MSGVSAIGVNTNAPSFSRWAQTPLANQSGGAGADPLAAGGGQHDLMSSVMDILNRARLSGHGAGDGVISLDDMQRLVKSLKNIAVGMGPQALAGLLKNNPSLTNMLSKAL